MDYIQDYYAILGVPATATQEELRQAYRLAAQHFHPDTNKAVGAALLFKSINEAYEVLSDRGRRNTYDHLYQENLAQKPGLIVETRYSRHHIRHMDEPQLIYVLATLQPRVEVDVTANAPLNLGLIIDRSTSMKGERLQQVKLAVHQLIDNLHSEDIISIVGFSDNAEVLVPAERHGDRRNAKSMVSTLRADGSTAILSGLREGLRQVERYLDSRYVNHIILITDGRTYGDEDQCLDLAVLARERGIGISGMGIGEDWNDSFLDALVRKTGGSSAYIASPNAMVNFLYSRIRSLATAYAERAEIVVVPVKNVELKSLTRINPESMTLPLGTQPLPLGTIDGLTATSIMLQFHVQTGDVEPGEMLIARLDLGADLLGKGSRAERVVQDLVVEVGTKDVEEEPPPEILDALSKLMLYRLQDRAREAIALGNFAEATHKLEVLATRLLENGQDELAQSALQEAQRVAMTQSLSDEGAKQLKYGTRALIPLQGDHDD